MHAGRPVIVMQAPERLYEADAENFCNELKVLLEAERPRLVLDCSQVKDIDSKGVDVLLHCMDEAMKRDGDIKLAALAPGSAVILELMKVDRLFEIFDTPGEAVQSFHALPAYDIPPEQHWVERAGNLEAAS
jgi:anti-sigma B factor antagonist